jgi:uncharacterized protein (DUF1697 family)
LGKVKPYRASGNILLKTKEGDGKIRQRTLAFPALAKQANPLVVIRTSEEIRKIIENNPFNRSHRKGWKWCVTFLDSDSPSDGRTTKGSSEVEIIGRKGKNVFSLWNRTNGTFGIPNRIVEKVCGTKGTTRSWSTVCGIMKLFNKLQ